mmetsp:Transcript_6648/g.20116  ORF Transcript_6648/g.20116 Transcript_6648/m.20116 type:complete len:246 (-) Transcript_6648:141-878(-)
MAKRNAQSHAWRRLGTAKEAQNLTILAQRRLVAPLVKIRRCEPQQRQRVATIKACGGAKVTHSTHCLALRQVNIPQATVSTCRALQRDGGVVRARRLLERRAVRHSVARPGRARLGQVERAARLKHRNAGRRVTREVVKRLLRGALAQDVLKVALVVLLEVLLAQRKPQRKRHLLRLEDVKQHVGVLRQRLQRHRHLVAGVLHGDVEADRIAAHGRVRVHGRRPGRDVGRRRPHTTDLWGPNLGR